MVVAVAVAVAVAEKNTKTHENKTEKLAEIGQMLRAVRVSGEGGEGSWALTTVSDLSIKKQSPGMLRASHYVLKPASGQNAIGRSPHMVAATS